ncbi:NAD(P)-binding protein [Hymenobacter sp. AT01-02]|uniref:NAD(P)-binding protein n=1 Tax=Hymenobacter sp. AT01-02 TaxID=1571877 RepID=UPI0006E3AF78|nr:NAD(P)-binding protein [Hymenobacter sp. AT01-02]
MAISTASLDPSARIAIIGGGISGMVAAKTLSELGYHNNYVFEAQSELGGNSSTQAVQLGADTRWADMGVNDYNTKTYLNIYRLICELGAVTAPLDDTTSYSNSDGTVSYTVDGLPNTSLPYPDMSPEAYQQFQQDIEFFWTSVYYVANDPFFEQKTVADYLAQPYNPNNPQPKPYNYGPDFGAYYLLPRVNGMYFAPTAGPQNMPIVLVTHYYVLQEGFNQYGSPNPDRRYFVGGTRQLVDRIQDWLLNDYDLYATDRNSDEQQGLGKFMLGEQVTVSGGGPAGYYVNWTSATSGATNTVGPFASVILAVHADAAYQCLSQLNSQDQPNLPAVLQNLSGYQYEACTAYIHTDARVLPADVNAWRSFNIHIYEYPGAYPYSTPYTISYLENRHQNDALNLSYRLEPYSPQFFTTLNPPVDLLPRYILQSPTGQPAIKTFYHNVATMDTIGLQRELAQLQEAGALNGIYFTGGYTLGVGLHEECWISANHAARRAVGISVPATHATYGSAHPDKDAPTDHAPHYLRHALRAR